MIAHDLTALIKDLPAVSSATVKLLDLLNDPDHHTDALIKVMRCDQVLTAKLLRVCNSAFYHGEETIGSLEEAVLRLGEKEIMRLVLILSFGSMLSRPLPGYAMFADELWQHALTAAVAAQHLAGLPIKAQFDPSVAFTAGLLHDIGKLVLNQVLAPDTQQAILALIQQNQHSRVEAEQAVLNTDHAEVGGCLLAQWHLPAPIVEAVAEHHRPPNALSLASLVNIANCIAHILGSAPGWESFAIRAQEAQAEALGLNLEQLEQAIIAVQAEAQQAQGQFKPA